MDVRKIPTSPEVYAVIFARHRDSLVAFASYSNPDGHCPIGSGYPEMYTEWGFEGADHSILATRTTWEKGEKDYERKNEKYEYWICVAEREDK